MTVNEAPEQFLISCKERNKQQISKNSVLLQGKKLLFFSRVSKETRSNVSKPFPSV